MVPTQGIYMTPRWHLLVTLLRLRVKETLMPPTYMTGYAIGVTLLFVLLASRKRIIIALLCFGVALRKRMAHLAFPVAQVSRPRVILTICLLPLATAVE